MNGSRSNGDSEQPLQSYNVLTAADAIRENAAKHNRTKPGSGLPKRRRHSFADLTMMTLMGRGRKRKGKQA